MLETGSAGEDLWGFNLYPDEKGEDFIEYDSLISVLQFQEKNTLSTCRFLNPCVAMAEG